VIGGFVDDIPGEDDKHDRDQAQTIGRAAVGEKAARNQRVVTLPALVKRIVELFGEEKG
jgi:hypothetical protein